jgi:SAM-dependent methyltransferase
MADPVTSVPGAGSPDARNRAIVDSWDALAEQWNRWTPFVDEWFAPATERMLRALQLSGGEQVLELAAGTGGFTRHLALAVGTTGHVLATDSGPSMVRIAARNAQDAGRTNVTVEVMDGARPTVADASADAVACRQGFMFFPEPETVLRRLLRVLRPKGRLSVSVFATPERNAWMTTPVAILQRWASPAGPTAAPAEGPGPFSLSEPGRLERLFVGSGFEEVRVENVPCPLRLPTVGDLVGFYLQVLPEIVGELPPAEQAKAWEEVRRTCAAFVGPGSAGAPCELLVASGRRPAV